MVTLGWETIPCHHYHPFTRGRCRNHHKPEKDTLRFHTHLGKRIRKLTMRFGNKKTYQETRGYRLVQCFDPV
jgi:hypothetical protein